MRSLVAALLLCVPAVATAQWSTQPGGDLQYTLNYVSSATFSCTSPLVRSSCLAFDNSLLLTNGSANATISFTGVSNTITATNVRTGGMPIGTFSILYGGVGPFSWPSAVNSQQALFGVRFAMTETSPILWGSYKNRHFRLSSSTKLVDDCCDGDGDYFEWGVAPAPTGYRFGIVVDNFSPMSFTVGGPTSFDVTAAIGIVPEPSTCAMMFCGLVTVGLVRRKRA